MLRYLSSLKLTIFLLSWLAALTMIGALIPQGDNRQEFVLLLGRPVARFCEWMGLTSVFQSPLYVLTIGALFLNLAACTISKMVARIAHRVGPAALHDSHAIEKLPGSCRLEVDNLGGARRLLCDLMQERGFTVQEDGARLLFCKGRLGYFAGPVTHVGLFMLLAGVIISSLFGYTGDVSAVEGATVAVPPAGAAAPVLGRSGRFWLRINRTWRDNYPSGQPKQWYSDLQVRGDHGGIKSGGTTSVNNPLTLDGIDYYQSDWYPSAVDLQVGQQSVRVPLTEMSRSNRLGILSVTPDLSLVTLVSDDGSQLRAYAKQNSQPQPQLLSHLKKGQAFSTGPFSVKYTGPVITTTLHYKHDPGQVLTLGSLFFFMLGATLVALPRCRMWACSEETRDGCFLVLGWEPTPFSFLTDNEAVLAHKRLAPLLRTGVTAS